MNYFKKLHHHSPFLSYFLGFFTFSSLFFNLSGLQTTPFYVWGMFSETVNVEESPPVYAIICDKDTLDYTSFATSNVTRSLLCGAIATDAQLLQEQEHPLRKWLKNKLHGKYEYIKPLAETITTDTIAAKKTFQDWLQRYIAQQFGKKNAKYQIIK